MSDFAAVGKQFIDHYYNVFDTDRAQLAPLYAPESMLTFEGEQFLGFDQIGGKLGALPSIKHNIQTTDYQPTMNNGIVAFVTGELSIDGDQAIKFSQVFHLATGGTQGYYVHNDLFRMNC